MAHVLTLTRGLLLGGILLALPAAAHPQDPPADQAEPSAQAGSPEHMLTDPLGIEPVWPEGRIREKFKRILERLKIDRIPPETGTLVPGVELNLDAISSLKGHFRGGLPGTPRDGNGKPLIGNWNTSVDRALYRMPSIWYDYEYKHQDPNDPYRGAFTVKVSVHHRSPRDSFLEWCMLIDGAPHPYELPTFGGPAIGDYAAVLEDIRTTEGGTSTRELYAITFVRHNIVVSVGGHTGPVGDLTGKPSPTVAVEAVARHLDGLIKNSTRYQSIADSGLAPIIDEFLLAGVEGFEVEMGSQHVIRLKARNPNSEIPPDLHVNVAGMDNVIATGVIRNERTGEFRLFVGDDRPLERVLRVRAVNTRGCMTEKIVRYKVKQPPPEPRRDTSGG